MLNRIFYIAGPDGSGKTTFLDELESLLKKRKLTTRHIWIRSPKIFSKPLMGICRLIGLTKYRKIDGIVYGKHEFYRSKVISFIFPYMQLLDFKIKWFMERMKIEKDEIILFDRFNIDTLADLMVDTRRYDLHKTWVGKEFLKYSPSRESIVILSADIQVIRNRKLDTLHDELLECKIKVFSILSADLGLKMIENNADYDTSKNDILSFLLDEKD